jgi:hypothetical protein
MRTVLKLSSRWDQSRAAARHLVWDGLGAAGAFKQGTSRMVWVQEDYSWMELEG